MEIPTIPKPLEEGLYFAMRCDFTYCRDFVLIKSWLSVYDVPDRRRLVCHPLESVILRHPVFEEKTDQIAKAIGVDRAWVTGFCDALNDHDVSDDACDWYRSGYCLAHWPPLRKMIDPLVPTPPAPPPLFVGR